ncbi:MAG: class 2 transcription repressor NC2 subunit alpha [Amphiamblys sp. WSBS2006]|nr:MAG: class 2 transcription repressor NC2 subunit alpha [Amphiamblys sp. WSBS2006]
MRSKEMLPVPRVKRIMQRDEEVGKLSFHTPFLVAKATEQFLRDLVTAAQEMALKRKGRKIGDKDLSEAISTHERFDFLRALAETPDGSTGKQSI